MPHFLLRLLLLALPVLLSVPAAAQEKLGVFDGMVSVSGQNEGERVAALPDALTQVLVKLSGDSTAAALARSVNAANFMSQYRYSQGVEAVNGVPQVRSFLIATFDKAAVSRLLNGSGRVVWPTPRPSPLVLLSIDDGSGARLLTRANANAVPALATAADRRGVALRYPAYGADEQAVLGAGDVVSEETYAVDALAQRYGGLVLFGHLKRGGAGWQARWRLRESGTALGDWNADEVDSSRALAAGIGGAVDRLSRRYAELVLAGNAGRYTVFVDGIASAADFALALRTLRAQPIVKGAQVTSANDQRLALELDLSAGMEGLARLLESGGVLRLSAPAPADAGQPEAVPVFVMAR